MNEDCDPYAISDNVSEVVLAIPLFFLQELDWTDELGPWYLIKDAAGFPTFKYLVWNLIVMGSFLIPFPYIAYYNHIQVPPKFFYDQVSCVIVLFFILLFNFS